MENKTRVELAVSASFINQTVILSMGDTARFEIKLEAVDDLIEKLARARDQLQVLALFAKSLPKDQS